MKQDLTITLFQTSLHWQNPEANRQHFEQQLQNLTGPTDLVLLPEMFTTGFTMDAADLAETMDGPTMDWLRKVAAEHHVTICGSLIIKENDKFYNRLIWMRPDGNWEKYDKRHLFRMAGEDTIYTAGEELLLTELKGWNICPLVCYDLRFPVWSRNVNLKYDLLLYVANWPAARSLPWQTLLRARAIENLAYVAGLNRIREDGKGHAYSGDSAVIHPKGLALFDAGNKEAAQSVTLPAIELEAFRKQFPAHLDADNFELV